MANNSRLLLEESLQESIREKKKARRRLLRRNKNRQLIKKGGRGAVYAEARLRRSIIKERFYKKEEKQRVIYRKSIRKGIIGYTEKTVQCLDMVDIGGVSGGTNHSIATFGFSMRSVSYTVNVRIAGRTYIWNVDHTKKSDNQVQKMYFLKKMDAVFEKLNIQDDNEYWKVLPFFCFTVDIDKDGHYTFVYELDDNNLIEYMGLSSREELAKYLAAINDN